MKFTTYKLEVVGQAWGNFQSEHTYRIDDDTKIPTNEAEAKAIAVDFQSLISARVIKEVHMVEITETPLF